MIKNVLHKLEIKKLKGLNDVTIEFSKTLTAIMGVNGSGKTTILHALACIYSKERLGEESYFSNFFVPNPDAHWTGSEVNVVFYQNEKLNLLNQDTNADCSQCPSGRGRLWQINPRSSAT